MFVHLHTHSEYSTLDGMARIKELVDQCIAFNMPALAITDHGSTSGLYDLEKYTKNTNIKPILGTEFYFHHNNQLGHLIALAKSDRGLENIFKLQEYAYTKNFHNKPRINMDILTQYSTDLIISTACIANQIPQQILHDSIKAAKDLALQFAHVFGENFYLELQSNTMPEQNIVNRGLVTIHKETGIPLIITNDTHYTFKEDADIHEIQLAIQQNKKLDDPKRWKFETKDFWFKPEETIREELNYLPKDIVDMAIENTIRIAQQCNAKLKRGNFIPHYPVPQEKTEEQVLREITTKQYKSKIIDTQVHTKQYVKDVENELQVIERNGYSGYYLIVQDYVNEARRRGIIVGDGRGSGAGSKVAYITGITNIEPNTYGLLFERFLADGRQPDFDVDFSNSDAVFEYIQQKYGKENVARIIAFGTLTPKAAVRKVFSIFGHPMSLIAQINGCMPKLPKFTLKEAYEQNEQLLAYKKKYPKEFTIIERIEGLISHESQHAAGVIICQNLSSYLPIKTIADDRERRIVAFDKYMLEDLGHYKFDLLWLETLNVIENTIKAIKTNEGIDIDLHKIDREDENIYNMLCKGEVTGVFQLAEQAQKVIEQQPRSFTDLIAINALIRPGTGDWNEYIARRKGKQWSTHKNRIPYMQETEGLITYQEQFLLDCKTFAGWDIAFADKYVRKNKDIKNDKELRKKFIKDACDKGFKQETAELIWQEIEDAVAGGYSFNKSHSTSYAVISYYTAWLKYYYPKYFYAALMSAKNNKSNKDAQIAIGNIIAECKQNNIPILPPDINLSTDQFTATKEGIRYCITTITNVGSAAIKHIMKLRPIASLEDMIMRGEKRILKASVVEMLIKAGCFDFQNPNREELLDTFYKQRKEDYNKKIWSEKLKMKYEKESLGMYLTKHPLDKYHFQHITEFPDNAPCLIAGEIIETAERYDKNGATMMFITINNNYGNVRCIIFASIWNKKNSNIKEIVKPENIVIIRGRRSGDTCLVDTIELLE